VRYFVGAKISYLAGEKIMHKLNRYNAIYDTKNITAETKG
jgi:hypothetical protein